MSNFCLLALVQAEPSMQQNVFYAQPQMGQQPIMMMPSMAGMTPMAGFVGGGAGQFYQQVGYFWTFYGADVKSKFSNNSQSLFLARFHWISSRSQDPITSTAATFAK